MEYGINVQATGDGTTGRMLRDTSLSDTYLSDRKFKAYFEGDYSAERSITSGAPRTRLNMEPIFCYCDSDIFCT